MRRRSFVRTLGLAALGGWLVSTVGRWFRPTPRVWKPTAQFVLTEAQTEVLLQDTYARLAAEPVLGERWAILNGGGRWA